MPQEATFPYVLRKEMINVERGNTLQYVCINPSTEELLLVYVHTTQLAMVKDDRKTKEISLDVNYLTKFRPVEYTGNVKVLRFGGSFVPPVRK